MLKKVFPFMLVYATVPALIAGIWFGGWANLAIVAVAFMLIPFADAVTSHDLSNPGEDKPGNWVFNIPLYLWVPLQLGIIVWGLIESTQRTGWNWFGLAFGVGLLTGGVGITIAHEFMHRKAPLERALAEVLMLAVTYPHFCIEHVYGHHKHVATPQDAATSRLGESLYAFLPRVIVNSLRSAIEIERKRTKRAAIPWYSPKHRLTRYALLTALVFTGVGLLAGPMGILFFAIQSLVAINLLEIINYVEHYGLQRKEKSPGKYERVQPHHSWNANHRFSNLWLFNLQRHADHHAYASRPYYQLRTSEEGPQLPYGYPTMVLMSFVPPLWRAVMDRRVLELTDDASNLQLQTT